MSGDFCKKCSQKNIRLKALVSLRQGIEVARQYNIKVIFTRKKEKE